MSINDDLFRAILAMDSYHRDEGGLRLIGSEIGTATILDNSVDRGITGFSFFAQAYTWNGKTVISYRGTDNIPVDAATGWITGGGAYRGPQAQMAADFYKAIINSASPYSPNIEFTGHSLGGGLAAMMASLYGKQAVTFDNMPYQLATLGAYQASVPDPWRDVTGTVLAALNPLRRPYRSTRARRRVPSVPYSAQTRSQNAVLSALSPASARRVSSRARFRASRPRPRSSSGSRLSSRAPDRSRSREPRRPVCRSPRARAAPRPTCPWHRRPHARAPPGSCRAPRSPWRASATASAPPRNRRARRRGRPWRRGSRRGSRAPRGSRA